MAFIPINGALRVTGRGNSYKMKSECILGVRSIVYNYLVIVYIPSVRYVQ